MQNYLMPVRFLQIKQETKGSLVILEKQNSLICNKSAGQKTGASTFQFYYTTVIQQSVLHDWSYATQLLYQLGIVTNCSNSKHVTKNFS